MPQPPRKAAADSRRRQPTKPTARRAAAVCLMLLLVLLLLQVRAQATCEAISDTRTDVAINGAGVRVAGPLKLPLVRAATLTAATPTGSV